MELDELHVAQLNAGPIGQRRTVTCGHRRVGRFTKDLSGTAGAENRLLRPNHHRLMFVLDDQGSATATFVAEQVDRERVLPDIDVGHVARPRDHRPHHFLTGRIAASMNDSLAAMSSLSPQRQLAFLLVELGPPAHQLLDPSRSFTNHHVDDLAITQIAARRQRVGHVRLKAIVGIQHAGDPALGVAAVGLAQAVLGHHQDRLIGFHRIGGAQPGQSPSDDQDVGESVERRLRIEGQQVARGQHLVS